jgi:epoxyqueuosine reductase
MDMNETLTRRLSDIASNCGADLFGIADVSDFSRYTDKRNPHFYADTAKSVIVIGYHINDPILDAWLNSVDGKRHRYFINEILGNIALEIISTLLKEGKDAVLTPYSGIFVKDAAALANLGVIGKNNLLLTKRFGPRLRLRTIVTEAELMKNPEKPESLCDDCPRFCWSACPADAFATGRFNREVCIDYSEKGKKRLSDNAALYCRECELACPIGES